jgi:hypothetical protein
MRRLASILLAAAFLLQPNLALASSVAKFPGTASGASWTTPTNIEAADGATTVYYGGPYEYTPYLWGTNFGFSIPTGATINGIYVEQYIRGANAGVDADYLCKLTKDGSTLVGTNKGTGSAMSGTLTDYARGGASDLWGTTWTPAQINASTFGVVWEPELGIGGQTDAVYCDYFKITVYYTLPGVNFSGHFCAKVNGAVVTLFAGGT